MRALRPLLDYLRELGIAPPPSATAPATASEALLERYASYLLVRRGLAAPTVRSYVGLARAFLSRWETAAGELDLKGLDAAAVSEFVLEEARRLSVGSAKCMVTQLRWLLHFLHMEGEVASAHPGRPPGLRDPHTALTARASRRRGRRPAA